MHKWLSRQEALADRLSEEPLLVPEPTPPVAQRDPREKKEAAFSDPPDEPAPPTAKVPPAAASPAAATPPAEAPASPRPARANPVAANAVSAAPTRPPAPAPAAPAPAARGTRGTKIALATGVGLVVGLLFGLLFQNPEFFRQTTAEMTDQVKNNLVGTLMWAVYGAAAGAILSVVFFRAPKA